MHEVRSCAMLHVRVCVCVCVCVCRIGCRTAYMCIMLGSLLYTHATQIATILYYISLATSAWTEYMAVCVIVPT